MDEADIIRGRRRLSSNVAIVYKDDASFSPMEDSDDVDVELDVEVDGQKASTDVDDDEEDLASMLAVSVAIVLLA